MQPGTLLRPVSRQVENIMYVIEGHLAQNTDGSGDLTRLDWVRRRLIDLVGIDPHPGTLRLTLRDEANRARWNSWRGMPGEIIEPEDARFGRARCYPVRLEGWLPAAVLLPESASYPTDRMELVAALPIRKQLNLGDDARIRVDLCQPLDTEAVLFDIDGTLVDSIGAYFEVGRLAAEPYGFEFTLEHVRLCMATGINFWKELIPEHHPDGAALAKAMSAHAAREWPRVLRKTGALFDGVAQTLDALKSRGIKLGIVSGARPEVMEILAAQGILDRFDTVVLGADVTRQKPDPEGISKALSELQVAPEAALYVGDTPIDIQASRSAGVRVVSVLTGAADSALLSAYGPDRIIASHARLPAIVNHP